MQNEVGATKIKRRQPAAHFIPHTEMRDKEVTGWTCYNFPLQYLYSLLLFATSWDFMCCGLVYF